VVRTDLCRAALEGYFGNAQPSSSSMRILKEKADETGRWRFGGNLDAMRVGH
jgi:hypothetical protein